MLIYIKFYMVVIFFPISDIDCFANSFFKLTTVNKKCWLCDLQQMSHTVSYVSSTKLAFILKKILVRCVHHK